MKSKKRVRKNAIIERLRGQIVSSHLQPGSRLPTRMEMEQKYKSSLMTVQRALEQLETEGFVNSRGSSGTFVSDHPPHLWRYALVFPHYPSNTGHWVRFWTALSHEAARIQHASRCQFEIHYDMDFPAKSADYPKLEAAIFNQCLAGVIFPSRPFRFDGTPVLDMPGLPRVAITDAPYKGVPAVALDSHAFIDKALDYFVSRGRQRIAAVMVPGHAGDFMNYFKIAIAHRGLTHRACWLQVVAQTAAEWADNTVQLLLQGPSSNERPDALLITDDNLVEHAATGVIKAGLRTPDDLDMIGHCNFPWPAASVLPLQRLGFDASDVLRRCLEILDMQRQGKSAPDFSVIAPLFENELSKTVPEPFSPSRILPSPARQPQSPAGSSLPQYERNTL